MKKRKYYVDPLWLAFLLVGVAIGLMLSALRPAKAVEIVKEVPVEIVKEVPVTKVITKTVYVNDAYDEVTDEPELESLGTFKVSAYCSCEKCCDKAPDDPWYGITATGTKAAQGRTIAVDPKVIPYGSVVYFDGIDGFGGYVAEDCGGAIKGNEIDLYFDSHEEALKWGVRELEVYAMEDAK